MYKRQAMHAIPGLVFAYISDRNYRKTILLWIQALGAVSYTHLDVYKRQSKMWALASALLSSKRVRRLITSMR